MNIDPGLAVLIAVGITVGLWAAAIALGRVNARVTVRGFRNGVLVAAVLFAITVAIVTVVFNGRAVFVDTLDLAGAFELGLLVGALVALSYLWIGGVLIAIGLIFRSKPQWTTLGAWAAVPVIIVSLGFGYVSYRSVASEGAANTTANGSVSINLSGSGSGRISADGAATCARDEAGTRTIQTGTPSDPPIISSDGRLITATVTLTPDSAAAGLQMTISGVDTTEVFATPAVGSNASAGQLMLTSPTWTGTLNWTCNG